jgi:dipeptidyl aminopeptidase/acylaminoacyl peptidase
MMSRLVPACLALVALGAPLSSSPAEPAVWTPELAFKVKRVSSVSVSPDAKRVAYVVAAAQMEGEKSEWLSQIYVAQSDGRDAHQLTRGDKSSSSPAWSPDGRYLVFVSSRSGKPQIYRIALDGGEAEALTDEKSGPSSPRVSPDGKLVSFLMAEPKTDAEDKADKEKRDWKVVDEGVKMTRLYVIPFEKDAEGKRPWRALSPAGANVSDGDGSGDYDWSPDSRAIVFAHQPSPKADDWTRQDISVVEVETATVHVVAATPAAESQPFFSPDGRSIAYTASDAPPTWGTAARVLVVPAAGGAGKVLAETADRQPQLVGFTADGSRLFFAETRGTVNRLGLLPVDGGPPADLGAADLMVGGAHLNAGRTHVGFVSQSPDRPVEAFVAEAEKLVPVPVSHVQELPPADLGKTDLVSWKSADGKTIEGLLTYPAGFAGGARVPLLVIVHGGPTGVFVRAFTGAPTPYPVAVFAGHGYAVLRCNVRGSSGYGRDFRYANYRDWGGADYRDILSGVDSLVLRGIADPDRLGIMGWSYGGYMTSWVITQTRRFKAASVGAAVTNLMSFTGTSDIPGFVPDYFGGEYWDVFERWRTRSAMFNVKGVTTPTLIQHGEADVRVPVSQSYELYNALKRQGVTTRLVVYPREPHGPQEPRHVLDLMTRNLEWFDKFVLGKSAPPAIGAALP